MKKRRKEGEKKSIHRVVHLSPLLGNVALEKVLANVVRGTLGLSGYACAIPEPDAGGHDLWFATPRVPVIYRCQLKAFGRYEFIGDGERQYDQNLELEWFLRALHQPLFLLVIGLANHTTSISREDFRPPENNVEVKMSEFLVGYVPGNVFRGSEYKLSKKGKGGAINLHVRYELKRTEERKITLYGGAYRKKSGCENFTKDITGYFDTPELGISDLEKDMRRSCHTSHWEVSRLEKEVVGHGNKTGPKSYTQKAECGGCETRVLFSESEVDFVREVIERIKETNLSPDA